MIRINTIYYYAIQAGVQLPHSSHYASFAHSAQTAQIAQTAETADLPQADTQLPTFLLDPAILPHSFCSIETDRKRLIRHYSELSGTIGTYPEPIVRKSSIFALEFDS